jgi:putative Holliday junction resolvase
MAPKAESRILAVDYGMARLGLAVTDPNKIISFPLDVMKAEKKSPFTAKKLLEYIDRYCKEKQCTIELLVFGMPYMMSGQKGMLADEVDHFVALLRELTSIPIVTWDERLTTVMADKSLREASYNRKRRAQMVDAVSAGILLQNYLDSKRPSH